MFELIPFDRRGSRVAAYDPTIIQASPHFAQT